MASHEAEEGEEEERNEYAERARQTLEQPSQPTRRESSSNMDLKSKDYEKFRAPYKPGEGEEEGEGGEGEEPPGQPAETAEKRRVGSARGWGEGEEEQYQATLTSLREEYGSAEEGASGEEGESYEGRGGEGGSLESGEDGRGEGSYEDEGPSFEEGDSGWMVDNDYDEGAHNDTALTREEVERKRVRGGAVSGYKHKEELQATLERKAALKFIRGRREDVSTRLRVLKEAEEKITITRGHLEEIDAKAEQMRAEARELFEIDQFANRDKISMIKVKVAALDRRREDEQAALDRESELEYVARTEYNNAQIELNKVEDLEPQLKQEEEAACAEARILSELRAEKETQAALRFERLRAKRSRANQEVTQKRAEKTQEAVVAAKAGRVAAIKRVKEAKRREAEAEAQFLEAKTADRDKAARALLTLKENMGTVEDRIRGQNEKLKRQKSAVEQRRAAEKSEILAAGGNPYAVWRQQDAERKRKQKAAKRKADMKAQENTLLVQITDEERRRRAADEIEREHKAFLKEFQKEMGGQAKREKIQKYMAERTVGGKDILNPTGREMRIYPSKVTVLKDWKFGLGKEPLPHGAMPGEDVPPGYPRGYEKEDPAGVAGEGWRVTQRDRKVNMMHAKYPDETYASTLVGSKSMGETQSLLKLRGSGGGGAGGGGMTEEMSLVAALGEDTLSKFERTADDAEATGEGEDEGDVPEDSKPKLEETHAVPEFTGLWTGADGGLGIDTSSKTWTKLSKLEQQYMREALERKKAGYGWIEKQVVWGKEFKGTAFVPSEKGRDVSGVVFKDFEPGRVYKRKVTLTNASLTFNTFKLLDLPDSVKDFFDITYTHPGAMSPGMACHMYITFEPKINEDIEAHIALLCQTGPQNISLRCLTKKADVVPKASSIEMDVIIGESQTHQIVLVNRGALDVPVEIRQLASVPEDDSPQGVAAQLARAEEEGLYAETPLEALTYPAEGVAGHYSTTKIDVTFAPMVPGQMVAPLHLRFPKGLSVPQSPDICVLVHAHAHEVPIYVLHETLDFKCCCYGQTYSQAIPVCNRGKVALKAAPQIGKELRGLITFSPDMAYVQARDRGGKAGRFDFQMKFEPTSKTLERCKDFIVEGPTGLMDTIEVPIRIGVPDQALPVHFTFRVQLTTGHIAFSRDVLDFGECALADSVSVKLGVTNESALPQRIGFMQLPREVTVRPNTGFQSLLPGETIDFDVIFEPMVDQAYDFKLPCITGANAKHEVLCRGVGRQAPIEFSCANFQLRACAPGDRVMQSFFCKNVSKSETAVFEVLVPKGSGVKLSPLVATLEPGQSIRMQIDYCPPYFPANMDEVLQALQPVKRTLSAERSASMDQEGEEEEEEPEEEAEEEGEEGEDGEEGGKKPVVDDHVLSEEEEAIKAALRISSSESVEGEAWSRHDQWQLPVFVKSYPTMFLEVNATAVMPTVVGRLNGHVMKSTMLKNGTETPQPIEFGKLPVGQEKVISINLTNISAIGTPVWPQLLDPFGAFVLLKSPAFMPPGSSQSVSIAFRPRKEATFKEHGWLNFMGGRLRYCLTGTGVSPHFAMEGLEVDSGMVDVGDVVAGGEVTKEFKLINNSPFDVTYTIDVKNVGESNKNQLLPMDCVPAQATVSAGGEQEVTLTFAADTESLSFVSMVRIQVPNQKEKMEYRVVGRCWNQALFLYDPSAQARSRAVALERFKEQEEESETAATIRMEHTFPIVSAQAKEEAEFPLRLGNCGKGVGEVVWENLSEAQALGFLLDPPPGKIDAGGYVDFSVKYTPGEGMALSMWNDIVLSGSLKGGDPAPAGGVVPVQIKLRGFLPPADQHA